MSYFLGWWFVAPEGWVLKNKDFLIQEFVNSRKWLFFMVGFIRLTPHPKGPPNGVDYAFASSEPTSSWPQTQHILFQKQRPNGRCF